MLVAFCFDLLFGPIIVTAEARI